MNYEAGSWGKIASLDSVKWFSILVLSVYARESKWITFHHRITSLRESAPIENQNQVELYQTGLYKVGKFEDEYS